MKGALVNPRRSIGLLLLVGLATWAPSRADRLHLEGGGHVDVGRWWIDGDWVYYDGAGGTVGLPRSVVTRIESRSSPPAEPVPPAASHAAGLARAPSGGKDLEQRLAQAGAALARREFETSSRAFWDLLQEHPELLAAQVGYAVSEIALERDGMALSVVLDGLARTPDQPALLELLGDLRNRDERVEDALRNWRAAHEREPSPRLAEKIAKAEREIAAGRDYDLATTSHFTVRFDGDVDRALAADVMDYLEAQYLELSRTFRHGPPQPITVLLYPRQEFREVTRSPEWVGGIYDGKIRVPLAGLRRLDPRAQAVLRHELTHAFVHSKTRGHCPRWLHEGLAQIVEGRRLGRADRRDLAGAFGADGALDWESRAFSYPAALSLTRFLEARRGFHGLVWVLDQLGNGMSLDRALEQTYGLDYRELCARWSEQLEEQKP